MSDEVEPQEQESQEAVTAEEAATEQDENWAGIEALRKEREARKSAAQELSEARKRLQEYEDRDKTEEQKRTEEKTRLEAEIAELTAAKTLAEVSAAKSVPAEVLRGPVSANAEDVEAYAEALIKWRGDVKPEPESPGVVSTIGQTPERPGNVPIKDQIAAAEQAGDRALVAALKSQMLGQSN